MVQATRNIDQIHAPILLHENRNDAIFEKISSIFTGFCPSTIGENQHHKETEDEYPSSDESEDFLTSDIKTSDEDQIVVASTAIEDAKYPHNSSREYEGRHMNSKQTTKEEIEEEEKSAFPYTPVSFFKMIISCLVGFYLLTTISYCHFGVESLFDKIELTFLKQLKAFIEPYASNIVIAQFLLMPLLYFFHYEGSESSGRVEVDFLAKKKRAGMMGCSCQDNIGSQVITSNGSQRETVRFDSSSTGKPEPLDMAYDTGGKDNDDHVNVDLDEATRNLPPVETWKYRPLFIQAAADTKCPGHDPNQSLPIGVPFDFESKLFKGKILFRTQTGTTDDPDSTKEYFDAHKFQFQIVIQGRFKMKTKMSEVWMGDIYDKKFKLTPPPTIAGSMSRLFSRLAPGIVIDMVSNQPKILALIGSGSHTLSIDEPGHEPDIMAAELPEKTDISNDMRSSLKRKKVLGKPETASAYEFDPNLVYTFHTADEALDITEYKLRLLIATIDLTKILGEGQPISLRAINGESSNSYFFFRIWHESALKQKKV